MKGLSPTCLLGKYDKKMRIVCELDGMPCAFQYFKACRGWWENSENAMRCLKREREEKRKEGGS